MNRKDISEAFGLERTSVNRVWATKAPTHGREVEKGWVLTSPTVRCGTFSFHLDKNLVAALRSFKSTGGPDK